MRNVPGRLLAAVLAAGVVAVGCGNASVPVEAKTEAKTEAPAATAPEPAEERIVLAQNDGGESEAPAADAKPKSDMADKLTTQEAKTAYAIGLQLGLSVKDSPYEIDMDLLEQGINDMLEGKEPALTTIEVQEVLMNFRTAMQNAFRERKMREGEENIKKAQAFLEENGKKDGVKTTESGLQYKVISEGSGKKPSASSQVRVHYRGTLIDGTQFDSSYDRGQPASFGLDQVIPGWTEGLQLMTEGSKYELAIPPDLGYGLSGPDTIPANSVLLFEVELLEVLGDDKNGGITIQP